MILIAVLAAGRAAVAEGAAFILTERAIRSLAAGPQLLGSCTGDEIPGAVTLLLEPCFLNDCLADAARTDEPFEPRIDTPQRNAGRRVQVLNDDTPVVRL